MIRVSSLSKHFSDRNRGVVKAVDELSFEVHEGEVFGLLGPNGAGKTTALRLLATLLKPTSGTAVVCGHDIREEPDHVRSKIGFLSGDMGLYHRLTPREVLSFFGIFNGLKRAQIAPRVDEVLALLQLEEVAGTRIDSLSTGLRQRVAVARTIIHSPPVLILDEPTAGLDVPTARTVEQFVLGARNAGHCIVYSTHFMEEAEYLCDRIAVIHQGRTRIVGTMQELRRATG